MGARVFVVLFADSTIAMWTVLLVSVHVIQDTGHSSIVQSYHY